MLASWRNALASGRPASTRCGIQPTGQSNLTVSAGVPVIEVNRPDRATRRRRGKTDTVDAEAAARAVLAGRATVTPKTADGAVEVVRLLKVAKDSAVKARTQAINQLKAVLVGADSALRESLAGLGRATLVHRCTQLPDPNPTTGGGDVAATATHRGGRVSVRAARSRRWGSCSRRTA